MFGGQARIGVDVGGTFTDAVLEVGDRRFTSKVLTTPRDPEHGCMRCIEEILSRAGLEPDAVGAIIHGTTLATNSIIERKGATTSLLTTEGFRDTLQNGHRRAPRSVRHQRDATGAAGAETPADHRRGTAEQSW